MTWEYSSNPQQWTMSVGEWRGVARRTEGSGFAWHTYVERITIPTERYDGPTFKEAVDTRTWCLGRIAALRASAERGA